MDLRVGYGILTAVTLFIAPAIEANDEQLYESITKTLQSRYPDMKILGVRQAPMPTLYEVFTGNEIVYTNADANYLVSGLLIDTKTKTNLTKDALDQRYRIDFKSLPLEDAIVVTKGEGTRKLAVFTDPDCPFCKKLEEELVNVDDVTVYSFLYPLPRLHPEAPARARAIWCSNDRVRAWADLMLEKKEPAAKECDDNPVDELQVLGQKLNVNLTPTIYFESGRRVSGYMPAADLDKALNEESAMARR